jgi:trk system potassium uptake protein TrkA
MLGINLTVSATATILALVEHELPEHELVTLLDLRRENLEIVEFAIDAGSPVAGRTVRELNLPSKSRLISVSRAGKAEIAVGETELRPGDLVMAILEPGVEDDLKRVLMATS